MDVEYNEYVLHCNALPFDFLILINSFMQRIVRQSYRPNLVIARHYGQGVRWLGFFGRGDKWTDCCTFPLWKEQIRCEDRDETIPLRSRPG